MDIDWKQIIIGICIAFVILISLAWIFEFIITPLVTTIQGITQDIIEFIQLVVGAILLGVLLGFYFIVTEKKR